MIDCNHEHTRLELLAPGQEHYARVVCATCGTTLCFRPHPQTLAKRQQNAANIQQLLSDSRLTAFERGFLTGLRNHKPTPQQQQALDALVNKYILNQRSNSSDKSEHITGQRAELATA
jgi:hypothetical protein